MRRILILLLILFTARIGSAEDFSGYDLSGLKSRVATLLRENEKLVQQYEMLKQEHAGIEEKIKSYKKQIADFQEESFKNKKFHREKQKVLGHLQESLNEKENEFLLKKSRRDYLKGKNIDAEQQLRLWRLKLADLQYQKRQLELDIKYQEFLSEDKRIREQEEINELRQELIRKKEREEELLHLILEAKRRGAEASSKVERLESEIDKMRAEIKHLEKKVDYQEEKNAHLKKKRMYVLGKTDQDHWETEQEKIRLQEEVARLEKQYGSLNWFVDESLYRQKTNKSLVQDVIDLDRENQELRQQINDLEKKIGRLRE